MKNFNEKNTITAIASAFFVAIISGLLLLSINAFLFEIIWNAVMPVKFGLSKLDFFDSIYIILLSYIIFSVNRNSFDTEKKSQ